MSLMPSHLLDECDRLYESLEDKNEMQRNAFLLASEMSHPAGAETYNEDDAALFSRDCVAASFVFATVVAARIFASHTEGNGLKRIVVYCASQQTCARVVRRIALFVERLCKERPGIGKIAALNSNEGLSFETEDGRALQFLCCPKPEGEAAAENTAECLVLHFKLSTEEKRKIAMFLYKARVLAETQSKFLANINEK
jgi:hypothetical protein